MTKRWALIWPPALDGSIAIIEKESNLLIARVFTTREEGLVDKASEHARLMVAAPKLLEMMQELLDKETGLSPSAIVAIEAAIAAALGQEETAS